jgi:ferredoxin
MQKTEWKSVTEIEFILRDFQKISIISCGACANLCNTGGNAGIKSLKGLLEKWGKEEVLAKVVIACCAEEIMRQAFEKNRKAISGSDALVMLSCASGVKSAFLNKSDVPIITILDSMGNEMISQQENPVATGICHSCGHCVIAYTGGICPLSECPAESKYGPCNKAPENGLQCAIVPEQSCMWKEIEKTADLATLEELSHIHKSEDEKRLSSPIIKASPLFMKKLVGWMANNSMGFDRFIRSLK